MAAPAKEDPAGGGTGGGPTVADHLERKEGNYILNANQISLHSQPPLPPAIPGPSVITILAASLGTPTDGRVDIRGNQGVRITAGPYMLPPASSESTQGVEIVVGELQKVTIQRGMMGEQSIEMTQTGITVDAGLGSLTLKSLTEISLEVAGGTSKVTLSPTGVTIEGLNITLQGVMTKIN